MSGDTNVGPNLGLKEDLQRMQQLMRELQTRVEKLERAKDKAALESAEEETRG